MPRLETVVGGDLALAIIMEILGTQMGKRGRTDGRGRWRGRERTRGLVFVRALGLDAHYARNRNRVVCLIMRLFDLEYG